MSNSADSFARQCTAYICWSVPSKPVGRQGGQLCAAGAASTHQSLCPRLHLQRCASRGDTCCSAWGAWHIPAPGAEAPRRRLDITHALPGDTVHWAALDTTSTAPLTSAEDGAASRTAACTSAGAEPAPLLLFEVSFPNTCAGAHVWISFCLLPKVSGTCPG